LYRDERQNLHREDLNILFADGSTYSAAILANFVMVNLKPLWAPQSAHLISLKQLSDGVEMTTNRSINAVTNFGAGAVARAKSGYADC
jgi:prepilin-type processing-associated H-X9-DG protein